MADDLEIRVAELQLQNEALRKEIDRLSEELRQAREDADAAESRGFLLSGHYWEAL